MTSLKVQSDLTVKAVAGQLNLTKRNALVLIVALPFVIICLVVCFCCFRKRAARQARENAEKARVDEEHREAEAKAQKDQALREETIKAQEEADARRYSWEKKRSAIEEAARKHDDEEAAAKAQAEIRAQE